MAFVLELSNNTLSERVRNGPEFPVLRRGSNGQAYEFDVDAVVAHEAAKKVPALKNRKAR
jgi:hypothetical protein